MVPNLGARGNFFRVRDDDYAVRRGVDLAAVSPEE
jgi:hypothetical protein